jgi:hypothetical protein
MTPTPQRPSSSPPTVIHLCLLSIVWFVIRANIERLAYSSIYVFKRLSSSAGCHFAGGVLNMGGSGEDEGGGTGNDAAPWLSCMPCCVLVWKLCGFLLIYVLLYQNYMDCCILLLYDQYIPRLIEERMGLYSSVNQGIYGYVAGAPGGWGGGSGVSSIFLDYV